MSQNSSHTTTDHDEIKKWAESRGGKPAQVKGTENKGDDAGLIRLMFPDNAHSNDDKLEEVEWQDWFSKFDESKLALVYQDKTADGKKSSFNKLVSRDNA